jgi:hypothetical protein
MGVRVDLRKHRGVRIGSIVLGVLALLLALAQLLLPVIA